MLILVVYATQLQGSGGGTFVFIQNLIIFFDDVHLQIIASISPKASVEHASAQWAIFYNKYCTQLI